jgi:hypothetical protein
VKDLNVSGNKDNVMTLETEELSEGCDGFFIDEEKVSIADLSVRKIGNNY